MLEPVIHITAASKKDPAFHVHYDPNKNIILTIPDGTTNIDENAFFQCSALTDVHFPASLTEIEAYAFGQCTGLTDVHFPTENLRRIGMHAFDSCTGLTDVHFPEPLKSIGWGAFQGCTGLTKVHLPESLKFIQNDAFKDCASLTDIYCLSTKVNEFIGVFHMIGIDTGNIYSKISIHCPALVKFLSGDDSIEMELILRRILSPAEFRADLKEQVRSVLEEHKLLDTDDEEEKKRDFDLPEYFTKDRILYLADVDFKEMLVVVWK